MSPYVLQIEELSRLCGAISLPVISGSLDFFSLNIEPIPREGTSKAQPCGLGKSFLQDGYVVMALNQGSRKTSAHSCAIGGKTESGGLSLLSGPWPKCRA